MSEIFHRNIYFLKYIFFKIFNINRKKKSEDKSKVKEFSRMGYQKIKKVVMCAEDNRVRVADGRFLDQQEINVWLVGYVKGSGSINSNL